MAQPLETDALSAAGMNLAPDPYVIACATMSSADPADDNRPANTGEVRSSRPLRRSPGKSISL